MHLREAGHEVIRLVRRAPQPPDERLWNLRTGHIEPGALDGAEAVINLGGTNIGGKRWNDAYKQELRESRISPTAVLARAVAEHGVPVMISGSAVAYYGDTGATAVDETSRPGSGFLVQLCRDWEAATRPASDAGACVVLVRTGADLAADGDLIKSVRPMFSYGLGGRIGSGRQSTPWITLDDEIGAISHALESDTVRGPINATAPTPVTNAKFTRALARQLRRPAPWVIPKFAVRAMLGEFADESILVSQRILPAVLDRDGHTFRYSTITAALAVMVLGS